MGPMGMVLHGFLQKGQFFEGTLYGHNNKYCNMKEH